MSKQHSVSAAQTPVQQELPFASVYGERVTDFPDDLYIPPDALEVFLDAFEGPLDLLLYLIRKQNIDILDIPIAQITEQYMVYVDMMKAVKLELAAEYLVIAAMLGEIKSSMLLPKSQDIEEDEVDPRIQLIERLQEYERFAKAASALDELPRRGREFLVAHADHAWQQPHNLYVTVSITMVVSAYSAVMQRQQMYKTHHVPMELLSTKARMAQVLKQLQHQAVLTWGDLFGDDEGKPGAVVAFLALLELGKLSLVDIVQNEAYATLYIRLKQHE